MIEGRHHKLWQQYGRWGAGSGEVQSSVASFYYRQMTPFVIRVGSSAPQQNNRTEQKKEKTAKKHKALLTTTGERHWRSRPSGVHVTEGYFVCSLYQITSDHTFHQSL
jgi:hypothetical protein